MFEITIDTEKGNLHSAILAHCSKYIIQGNAMNLIAKGCEDSDLNDDESTVSGGVIKIHENKMKMQKIRMELGYGEYTLNYYGAIIYINHQIASKIMADADGYIRPMVTLQLKCDNMEAIKTFLSEMTNTEKLSKLNGSTTISCFVMNQKGGWYLSQRIPKRLSSTVFFDNKQEIFNDIQSFIKERQDYIKYGVPYKRNYLFYGPPGTGKTSLIHAIASEFNMNLHIIPIEHEISDSSILNGFTRLQTNDENILVVIEDIDEYFDEHSNVTFSTLLNTTDGILRKPGFITIMTTNHINKIDKTFLRPCRIDKMIEFKHCDDAQILLMLQHFYPNDPLLYDMFIQTANRIGNITSAMLHSFFFHHRNVPLAEATKQVISFMKNSKHSSNKFDGMYS